MQRVYRVVRKAIAIALPLQVGLHVSGSEHVPASGAAILVSNHLSLVDPLVVGVALSRELRILAKSELFAWPVIGSLARLCDVVPIRRGEWDVAALNTLEDKLRVGHCVLIFPEGTYAMPPHPAALLQFKIGAAWLAARVHAPVVPVAIWGSERVWSPQRGWRPWHRPRVYVHFGEPYFPQLPEDRSSHEALQPVADEMAYHICATLPERYHGYYHG